MEIKNHDSAREMYHRILQPTYERMVIQHVFKNKISLKSGATSQLLQKRPKTTGYLSRKRHFTEVGRFTSSPAATSYWKPSSYDQWKWNSKAGSTILSVKMMQDGHSTVYPRLTDDRNLKASSLSNTFSATTKVREVPVAGIYRKEIQELRCRSPSARGVRSIPLTNRSLIAPPQSVKSSYITIRTLEDHGGKMKGSHQVVRHMLEHERMERTKEMKRQAQISEHRMDRMYYMNGAQTRLHKKYDVSDVDLERLQAIAVSQGIKLSPSGTSRSNVKSTSAPNSTPRDMLRSSDGESIARTIIPTADVLSVGGDLFSEDSASEKQTPTQEREDAATSDHDDDVSMVSKTTENGVRGQTPEISNRGQETAGINDDPEIAGINDDTETTGIKDDPETAGIIEPESSDVKGQINDDEHSIKSDSAILSPEALNAPLAVSGAFLTDLTGGD